MLNLGATHSQQPEGRSSELFAKAVLAYP